MTFDWALFLDVAAKLAAEPARGQQREAYCRAAIGRVYYAAFGVACTYIKGKGASKLPHRDKHVFVMRWFRMLGGSDGLDVAMLLELLCDQRGRADYEERFGDAAAQAGSCLDYAKDAIELIRKLK